MSAAPYFIAKALVSGGIIALVSEVARRNPSMGALIVSLPLISIMGILWLWHDTADSERVAVHAEATFWYVLPTLPMFLVFPAMLRAGLGFWLALGLACVLTVVLYVATVALAARFGIRL